MDNYPHSDACTCSICMPQHYVCSCGSGKRSYWQYDARNIPICKTCDDCHDTKMRRYRKDVLDNPNYEADEPIEPEDY